MTIRLKSNENSDNSFQLFEKELSSKPRNFLENLGLYRKFNSSENIILSDEVVVGISLVSSGLFFNGSIFLYDRRKKEFTERQYQTIFHLGYSFQGKPENGFWTFDRKSTRLSYRSDFTLEHGYLHASVVDSSLNLQLDALTNLSYKNAAKVASTFELNSGIIYSERVIGFPCQGVVSWNDKVYDFSPKTDRLFSFFSMGQTSEFQDISLYFFGMPKKSGTIAGYFSNRLDLKNRSENTVWINGLPVSSESPDFNLNKSQKTCVMRTGGGTELRFIPENYIVQKKAGKFLPEDKYKVFGKVSGAIRSGKKSETIKDVNAFLEF